jgi:hypothetical protein
VKGLDSMEQERLLSNMEMLEGKAAKRPLSGEATEPPAKRTQWTIGNDDFVSRYNTWDQHGRGSYGVCGRSGRPRRTWRPLE